MQTLNLGISTRKEVTDFILSSDKQILHEFKNLANLVGNVKSGEGKFMDFASRVIMNLSNYGLVFDHLPKTFLLPEQEFLLSKTCGGFDALRLYREILSCEDIIALADYTLQSYLSLVDTIRSA